MMEPPLSSSEMDITMLMAKVDMVFSRLDTNKAQLRFERHMRVHKLLSGLSGIKADNGNGNARSFCQTSS